MKTLTKFQAMVLMIFSLVFLSNPVKAQGSYASGQTLLLITDKSLQEDVITSKKVEHFIKKKLVDFLTENNRQVTFSFIHEASGSATNRHSIWYNVPPIEANGLSERQLQQQQIKHRAKKFKARNRLISDVLNYYNTDTRIAESSAILASIKQIAATNTEHVEVIIFSDFINHSSIRSMYKTPLANSETAIQYAKEDAQKLKKLYDLDDLDGKNISVHCVLTVSAMDTGASNAHLELYYKTVLEILGIQNVSFSTLH